MTPYEIQMARKGLKTGLAARGPSWYGTGEKPAPRPEFPPMPDAKPGEFYVHVYEGPRSETFGHVRWFGYWYDGDQPNRGMPGKPRPGTTHGQAFHCDERPYMVRALEAGERVFLWPSGEEIKTEEEARARL